MVDYKQVYQAFLQYAATGEQPEWDELWITTRRLMGYLFAPRCAKLNIYNKDADDIIDTAMMELMEKLRSANDVTADYISSRAWFAFRSALTRYIRSSNKDRLIYKKIKAANRFNIMP